MSIITSLIIGAVAGFITGKIMGLKSSLLFTVVLGIVGGFVGSFAMGLLGVHFSGLIGNIICSAIGGCLLVWIVRTCAKKK